MSRKTVAPLELAKSALSLLQEGSDSEDEILALGLITSAVALHLLKQPKFANKRRRIAVQDEPEDDYNSRSPSPENIPMREIQKISPSFDDKVVESPNRSIAALNDFKIELAPEQPTDITTSGISVAITREIDATNKKRRAQWSQFEDERRRVLLGLNPEDSMDLLCAEPKITDYMSIFLDSLKMDIATFNLLMSFVRKDIQPQNTCMRMPVASEQRLAVILRYLSTGESYTSLEKTIKVSRSFLCVNIPSVCKAIWTNLKDKYLKLPSCEGEWASKAEEFDSNWQFPLCLGVLARRHFKFKSPRTANVLALIDANGKFLHIDIEKDDESVYLAQENAPPPQSIGNNRVLPYVFIAENGFDLDDHILTPYNNPETETQRTFNSRMSASARVADQTFRTLVKRFKVLSPELSLLQPNIEDVIKASCVLHNFLIEHNPDLYTTSMDEEDSPNNPDVIGLGDIYQQNDSAEVMRDEFADYFANEGNVPTFDVRMFDEGTSASNVLVDVMSL